MSIHREISNRVAVLERKTNYSPELTVGDYLFSLKGNLGIRDRREMKKKVQKPGGFGNEGAAVWGN